VTIVTLLCIVSSGALRIATTAAATADSVCNMYCIACIMLYTV